MKKAFHDKIRVHFRKEIKKRKVISKGTLMKTNHRFTVE